MGEERYQHLHWWLEMFWDLFPEEPMATLSVMAVSPRHPVLCCARYCTDIPCTEDLQDDVNSHEASGAQTHRGEAWGKARPDSCSPKSQVILCTSACPFSPSSPVGSDISDMFEEATKSSSVPHVEGASLPSSVGSKLQGKAGS